MLSEDLQAESLRDAHQNGALRIEDSRRVGTNVQLRAVNQDIEPLGAANVGRHVDWHKTSH
jgi:hypothetical protein